MAYIPAYILVIYALIGIDYAAGLLIEPAEGRRRRAYLVLSIIANIGLLSVFKYFNFFAENVQGALALFGVRPSLSVLSLALPVGISFHTFQSLAYTIEVYYRRQAAERSLLRYALYVVFYPQLVAGPIERPQHLMPQLFHLRAPEAAHLSSGLKRMAWGLFKKMVVADRLAAVSAAAFAHPRDFSGPQMAFATVCFAYQIYYDFSGYSDVALGAAQTMGIRMTENFNRPYAAASIAEFWQRWHISLSTWFRDYLFLPLSYRLSRLWDGTHAWGIGADAWIYAAGVMPTMLLCGLWHGAAWHYVVWGGLHGVYLAISVMSRKARARMRRRTGLDRSPAIRQVIGVGLTFGFVCVTWIFFRAESVTSALGILAGMGHGWVPAGNPILWLRGVMQPFGGVRNLALLTSLVALVELVSMVPLGGRIARVFLTAPVAVRWAAYAALVIGILDFGVRDSIPFIYFQF
jgi:D-alanyl-lipoteichoic acid acyltransferase DltB (MBOAT superfamily)